MGLLDGILKSVAAPLVSGVAGFLGQKDANDSNRKIAEDNSAFNAQQAQLNREFQERMSNTAYRRAVHDMREAGLNPMLAYQQGGASTPSGNAAQAVQPAAMLNAVNAGLAAAQQAAQVELTRAQVSKTDAETQNTLDENPYIRGKAGMQDQQVAEIRQRIEQIAAQEKLTDAQRARVIEETRKAISENKLVQARTGNVAVDTALKKVQAEQLRIINRLTEKGAKWPETGLDAISGAVDKAGSFVNDWFNRLGNSADQASRILRRKD